MEIELVATGDELLNGTVVDTNSPWLMERLAAIGLVVSRKTMVRDRRQDLIEVLGTAARRSEVVVASGGLGPTTDDLTTECMAEAAGVDLILHAPTLVAIGERLHKLGLAFTENNRRQARIPRGAIVHANRFGTAPMLELHLGPSRVFLLPGVPREYRGLCEERLLPALRRSLPRGLVRRVRTLHCFGAAESHLDDALDGLDRLFPGLEVGYRMASPENHVRLSMTGADGPSIDSVLSAATNEAALRIGDACFSTDGRSFSSVVGELLVANMATVALAESLTGGLAAALLTDSPGASRYVALSIVAYTESSKRGLLGVPIDLLRYHGTVSEPVAVAMAEEARRCGGTTFGLACTGVAGPDGDGSPRPIGTVFTALATSKGTDATLHHFSGGRESIRSYSAHATLDGLRRYFQKGREASS